MSEHTTFLSGEQVEGLKQTFNHVFAAYKAMSHHDKAEYLQDKILTAVVNDELIERLLSDEGSEDFEREYLELIHSQEQQAEQPQQNLPDASQEDVERLFVDIKSEVEKNFDYEHILVALFYDLERSRGILFDSKALMAEMSEFTQRFAEINQDIQDFLDNISQKLSEVTIPQDSLYDFQKEVERTVNEMTAGVTQPAYDFLNAMRRLEVIVFVAAMLFVRYSITKKVFSEHIYIKLHRKMLKRTSSLRMLSRKMRKNNYMLEQLAAGNNDPDKMPEELGISDDAMKKLQEVAPIISSEPEMKKYLSS